MASWFDSKLCAYCAGTSSVAGIIKEPHTLEWRSVLLICLTCLADGARPLVRARRRNGKVHERRVQRAHLMNSRALLVADEDEEQGGARGEATSSVDVPPAISPRVHSRERRRQ